MDRLYSRHPGGGVGIGLLLLRLLLGTGMVTAAVSMFGATTVARFLGLVLIGTVIFLVLGWGTSANASVGALCLFVSAISGDERRHWAALLFLAALLTSLALLGPGAYSLDARRSGWRTIDLPPRAQSESADLSDDGDTSCGL